MTRIVAAARERVFRAWTDAKQLQRWWAPKGLTTPSVTADPRPGGRFHYCMRTPEGKDIWGLGVYQEIVPPARIVYTDTFADEAGNPVPATHYGLSEEHPMSATVTVTFDDVGGKTRITLRHAFPRKFPERSGVTQGWNEMLERLDTMLAGTGA